MVIQRILSTAIVFIWDVCFMMLSNAINFQIYSQQSITAPIREDSKRDKPINRIEIAHHSTTMHDTEVYKQQSPGMSSIPNEIEQLHIQAEHKVENEYTVEVFHEIKAHIERFDNKTDNRLEQKQYAGTTNKFTFAFIHHENLMYQNIKNDTVSTANEILSSASTYQRIILFDLKFLKNSPQIHIEPVTEQKLKNIHTIKYQGNITSEKERDFGEPRNIEDHELKTLQIIERLENEDNQIIPKLDNAFVQDVLTHFSRSEDSLKEIANFATNIDQDQSCPEKQHVPGKSVLPGIHELELLHTKLDEDHEFIKKHKTEISTSIESKSAILGRNSVNNKKTQKKMKTKSYKASAPIRIEIEPRANKVVSVTRLIKKIQDSNTAEEQANKEQDKLNQETIHNERWMCNKPYFGGRRVPKVRYSSFIMVPNNNPSTLLKEEKREENVKEYFQYRNINRIPESHGGTFKMLSIRTLLGSHNNVFYDS